MTSSLVGSEMCIRDRHRLCGLRGARAVCGGCTKPRPARSDQASAPLQPVSYTHLTLPTICSV
eukprot:3657985-Prorocentrum_lima.AAC.1